MKRHDDARPIDSRWLHPPYISIGECGNLIWWYRKPPSTSFFSPGVTSCWMCTAQVGPFTNKVDKLLGYKS